MRIFTDGAEMGDMVFWTTYSGATLTSIGTRTGGYCYTEDATAWAYKSITPVDEIYLRYGFAWGYNGGGFYWQSSGGTTLGSLLTSGGYLVANNGAGTVGTTTTALTANVWYLVEIHVKIADSPNGIIQVKIDGKPIEIDYSGDTKPGADTTIGRIYFQGWYISLDDLALNTIDNSDGKGDISWCGDGRIVKITPSGSGTVNDWQNNGGVSASANYLYVDEYPNDGDTTYVYSDTSGSIQRFAMSDNYSGTGITVRRVFAEARIKRASTAETYVKIGQLALGGTDTLSGSTLAGISSYERIVGPEEKVNPVSGIAWTEADIDGLEFVAKIE